jgi:hypothetical protein
VNPVKKILFLAALFTLPASAQENYATAWSGHKYVIVNSAKAGIAAAVVKYPLLVRLDSTHASIFTQAKSGGADLRFTKADNATRLPHQIDSWNATARTAAIWVLADTIPANRNNFAFRIHWGNAGAADSSNGAKVFDTTNAFQAAWHMSGAANEADATLNAFTATQNGAPPSAPGAVGAGRAVSAGNYFRATGTASGKLNFPEGGNFSISAWVFTSTLPGAGTLVSKHDNAYALKLNADASNWEFFEFGTDQTAAGWNWVNASTEGGLNAWTHLVGFRAGTDAGIYVNGVRMDGGPSTAASTAARVLNTDVVIGAQPTSNTAVQRPFDGILDEVRLSSAARDGEWIKLDYETQKAGSSVVSLQDAIPASLGHRPAGARPAFRARQSGGGWTFEVDGSAAKARVTVLDVRGVAMHSRVSALGGEALSWDGATAAGLRAPPGVYAVRIDLLNARDETVAVLGARIPVTR